MTRRGGARRNGPRHDKDVETLRDRTPQCRRKQRLKRPATLNRLDCPGPVLTKDFEGSGDPEVSLTAAKTRPATNPTKALRAPCTRFANQINHSANGIVHQLTCLKLTLWQSVDGFHRASFALS